MTIDWDDLLSVYRAAIEDEAALDRVVRRYLGRHGHPITADRVEEVLAELERRHEAEPPPEPVATLPPSIPRDLEFVRVPDAVLLRGPPDPAPDPPPPPSAPQAEPAALSLPELAPSARQEPPMSALSPREQLSAAARAALSAAISHHGLSLQDGALAQACEALDDALALGEKIARRGALSPTQRERLLGVAVDGLRSTLPELADDPASTVAEIAGAALDAAIDTGTFEDVDGEVISRGLAWLFKVTRDLTERDPGNLEARAQRAEQHGKTELAARLRRAAARIRARG